MAAIEKFVRILAMTVPAFFARENPISRNAKPACMNMTRQPATITQSELIPTESGIPFFEPTASIRSATGRDMQPPWLARPQSSVSQPGSALDNGRKWRQGISPRGRKPPRMPRFEVSRTLVKSPPELWAELGPDCLEKALGAVSVQETEPEREMTFSGEGVHGSAVLEPAGWGTKVTLTAETEERVAKAGFWGRLRGPESEPQHAELEEKLSEVLDSLGSAHKRPFSRG